MSRSDRIILGIECVLAVILIALSTWSAIADAAQAASVSLGTWLVLPGSIETSVSPVLHFSPRTTPLLIIVACLAVLRRPDPRAPQTCAAAVGRLALLPLAAFAVLATDLVALIIVWILLDSLLTGACLRSQSDHSGSGSRLTGSPAAVLRLSSACLLVGVLVGVSRYHTTDMLQLARSAAADERVDTAQVVAGLSVCLAGAAAIRCGLFPGILWLRRYYQSARQPESSDILLVTILPGIALVMHLAAISVSVSDGAILLGGLGALTGIIAAAIAATQTSLRLTVPLLSICVVALGYAGSLAAEPDHGAVVLRSLLIQIPMLATVLLLSGESQTSPIPQNGRRFELNGICRAFGIAVLISGLAGPNAILHLIRAEALASSETLTLGLPRERICNVVWAACVFGQSLFAFGLIRGVIRQRRMPASDEGSSQITSVRVWIAAALTLGVVLAAGFLPMGGGSSAMPDSDAMQYFSSFLTFGPATPAALLGAVVAWLLYRSREFRESSQPVRGLESLSRLSGNWFYLEQVWSYGLAAPVRVLSLAVSAIDRHAISSGREEAWRFSASGLAGVIEHLKRSGPVYYGLSIVMVIAGLLLVLR